MLSAAESTEESEAKGQTAADSQVVCGSAAAPPTVIEKNKEATFGAHRWSQLVFVFSSWSRECQVCNSKGIKKKVGVALDFCYYQ